MKHRLKIILRRMVALVFHHLGLRAWFRASRGGVPMLMFHNVGETPGTEYLPHHMKTSERRLRRMLKLLKRGGYETITVGAMVEAFERGETPSSAVVLSFDDGYRDNHDVLLPILQDAGATATIFVQTGPARGKLNWLHHLFWVLQRLGPRKLAEMLAEHIERPHLKQDLRSLPADPARGEYELKRLLKYEVTPGDRDRILAQIFENAGGNERELASQVYIGPEECRALDAAGVELGAHTVNHFVLSTLEAKKQRLEIEGSLRDLQSWLGHEVPSFAYPYGRTWDYDEDTLAILQELGFRSAVTAMPGVNNPETPRLELRRFAVSDEMNLAEIMCEVDGVFGWFGKRGLNLNV